MTCPGCFIPGKETWYPLHRSLDGHYNQTGQMLKISSPPGSILGPPYTNYISRDMLRKFGEKPWGGKDHSEDIRRDNFYLYR